VVCLSTRVRGYEHPLNVRDIQPMWLGHFLSDTAVTRLQNVSDNVSDKKKCCRRKSFHTNTCDDDSAFPPPPLSRLGSVFLSRLSCCACKFHRVQVHRRELPGDRRKPSLPQGHLHIFRTPRHEELAGKSACSARGISRGTIFNSLSWQYDKRRCGPRDWRDAPRLQSPPVSAGRRSSGRLPFSTRPGEGRP